MTDKLPIEAQYPFADRTRLQLFSMNTPNGIKASVALEELALPYEAHLVHIGKGDQNTPEYRTLSPNAKIPALVDPQGPGGVPLTIMESGAILIYLAEKTGRLMPTSAAGRSECLQWLFFQVGHVGPMFGQFGHFYRFAKDKTTDTYALDRYLAETQRLLGVIDQRLGGREFLVEEMYTIADIAIFPWVRTLTGFYNAGEAVGINNYPNVVAWLERILTRPAVVRGVEVCAPT